MWRENTAAWRLRRRPAREEFRSSKSVGNQPLRFPSLSAGLPGPPESFSIVKRTASLRYKKRPRKKNYRTSQPAETTRSKKTEITIYPESLEAIEKLAESRCSKI